jgi:CRISPR/Cas system-associated exonuclease Cas4 (RecB family)
MSERDTIKASEIAEYVFCNRAWWLSRVSGRKSTNVRQMADGTSYHQVHGRLVRRARQSRLIAYVLLAVAMGAIIFSILQLVT